MRRYARRGRHSRGTIALREPSPSDTLSGSARRSQAPGRHFRTTDPSVRIEAGTGSGPSATIPSMPRIAAGPDFGTRTHLQREGARAHQRIAIEHSDASSVGGQADEGSGSGLSALPGPAGLRRLDRRGLDGSAACAAARTAPPRAGRGLLRRDRTPPRGPQGLHRRPGPGRPAQGRPAGLAPRPAHRALRPRLCRSAAGGSGPGTSRSASIRSTPTSRCPGFATA